MSLLGTHYPKISPSYLKGTPSHVLPVVLRIKKTLNQIHPFVAKYILSSQAKLRDSVTINLPSTSKNITGSHFIFACVPSLSTLWATIVDNT